ncbi:MAG: histidinol dehydrogenase, partial [Rhodobacteraceae bacterium]|nr:histidinol dehydrogenase [Paracoccaceae bacterium]
MAREYLKKATLTSKSDASEVRETVTKILADIEAGGDQAALEYAARFDRYEGNILLTPEEIEAASALVPDKLKADIRFAHDNVRRFAEKQKSTVSDIEYEIVPGLIAG